MRGRLIAGGGLLAVLVGLGVVSCHGVDDAHDAWGTDDGSTSATSTSAYAASTGTSGAGGGGPGPDPIPPPPVEDPEDVDCGDLDPAQPLVLYISADESNSMGAATLAREQLSHGQSPSIIRTHEFLNYYSFDYAPARFGQLAIIPQMGTTAVASDLDLQIGVRSYDAPSPRRPMTITLVLDTSGSMGGAGIERERAVVQAIAKSLAANDIVNAVTWNTSNNVVLAGHQVAGPNDPVIVQLAQSLTANGGTDLHSGLVAGYNLAQQHYGELRLNRLVLISDGGANVGVTNEQLIAAHSEDGDKEGIYLVGVGTGPAGGYSDLLMDVVTDEGRGAYVYIDSVAEADHMFFERFDEVMEVAARGVQVQLTVPWYFQMHAFYGEEYSENPEEIEPQHLAPSDAMVFHQVLRACDASVVDPSDPVNIVVNWETPLTRVSQTTELTVTIGSLLAGSTTQLAKGKAIVAYAEALRSGTNADLHEALATVNAANSASDPELSEIAQLIASHPAF